VIGTAVAWQSSQYLPHVIGKVTNQIQDISRPPLASNLCPRSSPVSKLGEGLLIRKIRASIPNSQHQS